MAKEKETNNNYFPTDIFREFVNEKYSKQLREMVTKREKSLYIDYSQLFLYNDRLATDIILNPQNTLPILNAELYELADTVDFTLLSSTYKDIIKRVYIRLINLPETIPLRKIRAEHENKLIQIEGIVVRSTNVEHKLLRATYKHLNDNCMQEFIWPPEGEMGDVYEPPTTCPLCGKGGRFKLIKEKSQFMDWQKIVIQEKPEELPSGQLPRQLDVILEDDLVDIVRPGDRVKVVGILETKAEQAKRGSLPVFGTFLRANSVEISQKALEEVSLSEEDEKRIKDFSKDSWIVDVIINSIAPSIYGRWQIKEAIALALFGGMSKLNPDGTRIRGDIHVLIIGDPGLAKSQILQFASRVAPRAIYTTGKGSTAAGLTATVVRDKDTGEYMLEAGALVLADGGIAVIDEIDKMNDHDRVSIHEAMEQQTVSITKAGIVAKLNARATVIAAGNPKLGRYIPERGLADNINLPSTILSRFDLIFILIDKPGNADEDMASHILDVHSGNLKTNRVIDGDLLKKYIAYARKNVFPKLTEDAKKLLLDFFVQMRKKSTESPDSPILITPRQLEALIRISEAYARMRLSDKVEVQDAERAINIVRLFMESVSLDVESGKVDADIVLTGKPKSVREKMQRLLEIIDTLTIHKECATVKEIMKESESVGIDKPTLERLIEQMRKQGLLVEYRSECYKKV